SERRAEGRVPFVRRCALTLPDRREARALIVNINTTGAYLAQDDLGAGAGAWSPCGLRLPGRADELDVRGVVTWVNARQPHPVHSLPPGFGLTFQDLSPRARAAIEELVADAARRKTSA